MADNKTKRGSPDSKRLNKSEPYEMAYARKKQREGRGEEVDAAAKPSAASKTAAAGKAPVKKTAPSASVKKAAPAAAKKTASAARKAAPAKKAGAGRRGALDGSTPSPTERESRAPGDDKDVGNTAPASKRTADAVDLLTDDHLAADACFQKYKKLADKEAPAEDREKLARAVCAMLKAHTTIEEEIFYPAAREAGIDEDLMDEADVEHASAKELIAQIESGSADDDKYDAKVSVLGEYIEHHVVEEHTQMFSKCRRSKMDLVGLRVQMEARKAELMGGNGDSTGNGDRAGSDDVDDGGATDTAPANATAGAKPRGGAKKAGLMARVGNTLLGR